jgi:hypothetical protein
MSSGKKNKRFQESRAAEFLASPAGKALSSAAFTGVSLVGLRKILRTRGIRKRLPTSFKDMKGDVRGLSNKDLRSASGLSAIMGAAFAGPDKSTYANNLNKRLLSGGKLTRTERKRLFGGEAPKARKKKSKTGFNDVYWSPKKWGAAMAASTGLGSLVSGSMGRGWSFTPRVAAGQALLSFPTMMGEATIRKEIQTRALASRLSSGKDLLPAEKRLLSTMKKIRAEGGK